jgi:hypothetical protein
MTFATGVNVVQLFWHNLHPWWHKLSQNLTQYANSSVTGVKLKKLFWHNLFPWWHKLSQNLRQYTNITVNYVEKSFMILATGVNVLNIFWHNLCHCWHIFMILTEVTPISDIIMIEKVLKN